MLVDVENFKAEQVGWEDVLTQLDTIQSSTRQVLNSLRQLLHDLRGEEQLADGFVGALGNLIERFEQRTAISTKLEIRPGWPQALSGPASLNLYRIVEEALTNVRMHSGARSVRIVLQPLPDNQLALVIGDDGRGLDTDPSRLMGFGTIGMKERALFLGGQLRIKSEVGSGTEVRATFPQVELVAPPGLPMAQELASAGA
jgi:two-component system sensor histidine kinase DegS